MSDLVFDFERTHRHAWSLPAPRQDRPTDTRASFEVLMADYLRTALRALITQAEVMADPEYCRDQDAAQLAAAHAIVADKVTAVATLALRDALPTETKDNP